MTKRHTQLPWEQDGNQVFTSRGIVARCLVPQEGGTFNCQENAAFIVRACSSYPAFEKMREALKFYANAWIWYSEYTSRPSPSLTDAADRDRGALARAALYAAEAAEKKGGE